MPEADVLDLFFRWLKSEKKLKVRGRKKWYNRERLDRYVHGVLRKVGWKPSHKKK